MLEVKTPEALRTPLDVFRAPKRHEGAVSTGQADAGYRAFEVLYLACVGTPIVAGVGMVLNALANWPRYLTPSVAHILGARVSAFVVAAGLASIALGLFTAAFPKYGGAAVAAWLWLGILNLALAPAHPGIGLCLLAMSAGSIALAFLAQDYGRRG